MSNDFYTPTGAPAPKSTVSSSVIVAEFALIEAGFEKVSPVTGKVNLPVFTNAAGTAQETKSISVAKTLLGIPEAATAESDFVVSGSTPFLWLKKTLAEVKTILGLVLTQVSQSVGFTISGGTTSKTLTVDETVTMSAKANLSSPTFTGTPAAPTAADNTATTQLATTAFAKSQDAVLARLPDQAVNMTAAASGSSGITVADNDNIDFGTGNFSLVWRGSLPDWTPSSSPTWILAKIQDATNRLGVYINTSTGYIGYVHDKTGGTSVSKRVSTAHGNTDNTVHEIVIVVTRETVSVDGSISFYNDGVLLETISISAGTPADISNTGGIAVLGYLDVRYAGTCSFAATYNRALTAAEVLDLYRNGIAYADKWGSQTAVDSWTTFGDWGVLGATIGSTVTFTATNQYVYKSVTTPKAGRNHFLQYEIISNTVVGGGNLYVGGDNSNKITPANFSIDSTVGVHTTQLPGNSQGSYSLLFFGSQGVFTSGSIVLDNVYLFAQGATLALEPEGVQPSPGQCLDSSSNKLHAMQPATGSSLTRKKDTFEVRWTNTWAGDHAAQYIGGVNQAVLPVGCYIDSIIGVITGATIEDIILGDGSDTDRWVTITTGLATGTKVFTIANNISDGTNYKLVVDPDANFTGSIAWTINGRIL